MLSSKASSRGSIANLNNASNSNLATTKAIHSNSGSLSSLNLVSKTNPVSQEALDSGAIPESDVELKVDTVLEETEQRNPALSADFEGNLNPASEDILEEPENPYDLEAQIAREEKFQQLASEKRRTLREQLLDRNKASIGALTNSKNEQLLLDYVDAFNRQYGQLYPLRRDLILTPMNEFGVAKFVSTTIKPTQLPFKELYNYDGCASFVKSRLVYEPLNPPHELPKKLASPSFVLKQQSGNCFEYAILLTSLLCGSGYDAYVCSGYATSSITLNDQTSVDIKALDLPGVYDVQTLSSLESVAQAEQLGLSWSSIISLSSQGKSLSLGQDSGDLKPATRLQQQPVKYKVKMGRQLKSAFLEKQEKNSRAQQEKAASIVVAKEQQLTSDEADADLYDELRGSRVHAWVLVLPGKREIAEAFFIEPTTGKVYDLDKNNYVGIESVFNNVNYWVNMQPCVDGLQGISFDLTNVLNWEFVMQSTSDTAESWSAQSKYLLPSATAKDVASKAGPGNSNPSTSSPNVDLQASKPGLFSDGDQEAPRKQLEIPASWVDHITLTPEQYASKCPMGQRTVSFKNARLEEFDLGHRPDGLVMRITYYADDSVNFGGQIREFFEQRRDKLVQRIRTPSLDQIQELFAPGRSQALKRHIFQNNQTVEMLFYSTARADGLLRRKDCCRQTTFDYIDREDGLSYRSITYSPLKNWPAGEPFKRDLSKVHKMAEKFHRDVSETDSLKLGSEVSIQKKIYAAAESKIKVVYSLVKDQLFPCWREFKKWNSTADPKASSQISENVTVFRVDKSAPALKKQELYAQYLALLKDEQACVNNIKQYEKEAREILLTRQSEESDIMLYFTAYDIRSANSGVKAEHAAEAKAPSGITPASEGTANGESALASERTTGDASKEAKIVGADSKADTETAGTEAVAENSKIDYLSPFLISFKDPNNLALEEAFSVKDQCLQAYKQHLIDRATIIQQQLSSLTSEYQARQLAYSKNSESMTVEESEEYVQFCNDALFKIQILEKRLAKHKESASQKYIEMDNKLRQDKRLAILNRKA